MKKYLLFSLLLLLAGCSSPAPVADPAQAPAPTTAAAPATGGMGMGMRLGMNSGMMERHRAPIPAPYKGETSPIVVSDQVLERGAEVFTAHCAVCHGDGGMGDGPTAAALDPAPAPIAHTSQMMGDDYLFWRVSEGGATFGTAMPVWKEVLGEQERWEAIHYVRALGAGKVAPRQSLGGAAFDPLAELAQRNQILAQAVEQAVITQAEADGFAAVHEALDAYRAANPGAAVTGNPADQQVAMLSALVEAGAITQAEAGAFTDIHDRLHQSGLME